MKPITIAKLVRVFAPIAMITLAIETKLGHMDEFIWVPALVNIMLLYMFIVSWSLIDEYKKEQQ